MTPKSLQVQNGIFPANCPSIKSFLNKLARNDDEEKMTKDAMIA